MGKFEVGKEVKVINGEYPHDGIVGVIQEVIPEMYNIGNGYLYEASELAPAQPATGGGADALRTDLDADTLANWPRMFRERATDPMFAGLYNEAGKNDILDLLDVVATLRTQLADANEALRKADAREKMYKHSVELHEEQYRQAKDNATLLYRELRKHISGDDLKAVTSQLNNNTNEYDKLMSDASRGREAQQQLADANARAAAAEARIDMLRGELENIYAGAESNSGRCIDCDSIKIVAYAALEADKRAAIETRQTAGE